MKTLFAVIRTKGNHWDANMPMRSQQQWAEHAAFMEGLAADGFVILGGPLGDGDDVLLVMNAGNKGEVMSVLSDDPWSGSGLLEIKSIQRWTILLESGGKQV